MKPSKFPAEVVEKLRSARRVVALTGAGISAESGVPTFREAQTGLWARFNPEELATPAAFLRNPKLVWEWYAWRRQLVAQAKPNAAHRALTELEQRIPEFSLITQNVDGLHRRAGTRRVIELHGNILRTKCFEENVVIEAWKETGEVPPRCPRCGGRLRPDVVWFEETLPPEVLGLATQGARMCDLFLSIGTSTVVQPAASLPYEALDRGAMVIEVNPEITPLTEDARHSFHGPAGIVLPALLRATWP